MATSIRIPEEDRASLIALGEEIGLLPADIIRAAIKAVLKAAKSNGGKLELPLHVRTKEEEMVWRKALSKIDMMLTDEAIGVPPSYPPLTVIEQYIPNLLNTLEEYGMASDLPVSGVMLRIEDRRMDGGRGFVIMHELRDTPTPLPRAKKPTK
jgi:hypothetical protein